ncbi:hypothetical protein DFH01_10250 [Falsiroseomonas bella]|uniref:Uncharacterized protein n=1 Tax=Falsiroseomonas bella TaxID=2184016 RepID=A0A317FH08_9PROT|nr:hypothetical protein DFH01_10250 [Falsiroseomonas bella]
MLPLAALLCAGLSAQPVLAQDGRPDSYPSAAATWGQRDRMAGEAFEQGYRMGREDERRRAGPAHALSLAWNDHVQRRAYGRMERAVHQLRRALVLLRRQDPSPRGERALAQAREALIRVQNAMTWLPPRAGEHLERRYERRSGRGIGAERASGGWAS